MVDTKTRRRFVRGTAIAVTIGLAGCGQPADENGTVGDGGGGVGPDETEDGLGADDELGTETEDGLGLETETATAEETATETETATEEETATPTETPTEAETTTE